MQRNVSTKIGCAIFLLTLTVGARAQEAALPAGTSSVDSAQTGQPSLLSQAEDAMASGKLQAALPLLNSALALEPTNARVLYDRGYVEEHTEHADLAAKDFQKAITNDPQQYEARAALGRMEASQGKFAEAQRELTAATQLTPASGNATAKKAEAFRLLASVDDQLHEPSAAAEALLAALKLSTEQPEDMLLAAQLTAEQGDAPGAAVEFRKALAAAETAQDHAVADDAEAGWVHALMVQKKYPEAEQQVRVALEKNPEDEALQAQLATVLAAEGKKTDAMAELQALHEKYPTEAAVTRMLADMETQAGEAKAADPLYVQLLAASAKEPSAAKADLLTARGANLIQQQRFAEAVPVLQKAAALDPSAADTWSDLAFAASQNQQYALVLTALNERATKATDAPAPGAMFLRATALDHLGRTQAAIATYEKFLTAAKMNFPEERAEAEIRIATLRDEKKSSKRKAR